MRRLAAAVLALSAGLLASASPAQAQPAPATMGAPGIQGKVWAALVKVDNIRDWGDDSDDKNLELYGEAGVEHADGQKKEWKRTDSNPQKSRPEYCPGGGICRGTGPERDSGVHIGYGQRINAEFTGSAASDSPFVFYTNLWDWDSSYVDVDEHVAWGSYKVWPDADAAKWTSNGCMSGRLCQVKSFTINGPGGPVMHIQFEKPAN